MPRILLFGGGDTSTCLPVIWQLLNRGTTYHVTSVVRSPFQRKPIMAAAQNQPGRCEILVNNLKKIDSDKKARQFVSQARPDWVVWVSRKAGDLHSLTHKLTNPSILLARMSGLPDVRDICHHFIRASASLPRVNTFLLISSIYSRRRQAPWWNKSVLKGVESLLHKEHAAKLTLDECVTAAARTRGSDFRGIVLRPGALMDGIVGGVNLGKTEAIGRVSRESMAEVVVNLLEWAGTSAWLDLMKGDEPVEDAVQRVDEEGVDCIEGEDVEAMMQKYVSIVIKGKDPLQTSRKEFTARRSKKIEKSTTLLEFEAWMRKKNQSDGE